MVFKKIIFQNRYVALETPRDPPPFMAKAILNFHFDFLTPSLSFDDSDLIIMGVIKVLIGMKSKDIRPCKI